MRDITYNPVKYYTFKVVDDDGIIKTTCIKAVSLGLAYKELFSTGTVARILSTFVSSLGE